MKEDFYGEQVKDLRLQMGMTQNEVANALNVTPGYISNVENGRAAMSLRVLMYYAKLMNLSLDSLVGVLEPEYTETALDRELQLEISKMDADTKSKLLKTIKLWNK